MYILFSPIKCHTIHKLCLNSAGFVYNMILFCFQKTHVNNIFHISVLAERCVKENNFENTTFFRDNLMCWQPIGHNNDPLIKCVILLLELELVDVSI